MPKDFYEALVGTGTLHVIALSGMNISILVTLVARLTQPIGRKYSIFLTIFLITGFVWFVGGSPSAVRAALMGTIALVGTLFGRRSHGLLSLFLSGLVMLLFDFSLISDLSFQLSFLATFGILLAERNEKYYVKKGLLEQVKYGIKENLKLTLSAQLFTVPLIMLTFHRISLISPITNLLVGWVIPPVMVLGFLLSIMGLVWLPFGYVLGWVVWVPLQYFITVVQLLSGLPGASVRW